MSAIAGAAPANNPGFSLASVRMRLESDLCTSPDIALACWCILLARITDRSEIDVAVAGNFTIRVSIAGEQYLRELCAQIRQAPRMPCDSAFCFDDSGAGANRDRFQLSLLWQSNGRCRLLYDPRRFGIREVRAVERQYVALLASACRLPECTIEDLSAMSTEEENAVAALSAGPNLATPSSSLPELIAAWARSSPGNPAVTSGAGALTYAELDNAAARLARYLAHQGAGPGRPVAIRIERSPAAVVAMLAAWKAGAAFIPLDPGYPEFRNARVLENAQPAFLLTDIGPARLCEPLHPAASPSLSAPACIIYTSGSTGDPKGVAVTHGNLAHYVRAMRRTLNLSAADVYLHTASFAFSSSGRQMFVPLAHGACVAIAAEDARRDPLRLFHAVRDYGVTILDLVPSHWRSCLEALHLIEPRTRAALLENRLRLALSASEPLPAAIPEEWASVLQQSAPFWNMFGHTETCGIVAAGPAAPSPGGAVAVGFPIPGVCVHVLDRAMRPVPLGWAGDIWVGGPTVAAGYWREAALTAAKFVATPQGTMYDTGDRGRYLPDGRLEFLGRRDLQVKIRGCRVDLTEVELALASHPDVRESAVAEHTGPSGETALAAWFVARPGTASPDAELRAFLRARLPEYMVPGKFIVVERLPRTPNGKLDRVVLAPSGVSPAAPAAPPATPTETLIANIWLDVLQLDDVGADTDFFQAGGHSLAAARVFARLRAALHVELPWQTIYDAPRLRQFAAAVDATRGAAETGIL